MKILHLTHSDHRKNGGVERHLDMVMNEQYHMYGIQNVSLLEIDQSKGYIGGILDTWWRWWIDRSLYSSGKDALGRPVPKIDIVHCHDPQAVFAAIPFPGKKVVTYHGYECYPVKATSRWLRKISRFLVSDCFNVGSYLEKYYGIACDKRNMIVGGVDLKAAKKFRSRTHRFRWDKRRLFLGRLAEDTGIRILLCIAKKNPKMTFDVYGYGPLEKLVLAAGKNIRYHGAYTGCPMELYSRYELAYCSHQLSILEAMSVGTAIIPLITNPLHQDLVESMGLPENPTFRERIGYAKRFSWRKIADKYDRVYRELLR